MNERGNFLSALQHTHEYYAIQCHMENTIEKTCMHRSKIITVVDCLKTLKSEWLHNIVGDSHNNGC